LGLDLELNLRGVGQYILYREGAYEPRLAERLQRELRAGDVFADVGAHIGVHALVAARHLQQLGSGHVYAFEPAPDTSAKLIGAAHRNGIRNITITQVAIGDSDGSLPLYTDPNFGRDDPGVRSAFGPGRLVGEFPMLRFDYWARQIGLERLDVVKMDVEGGEVSALVGMRETLKRLRPRIVVVEEAERNLARAGQTVADLHAELARSGYTEAERIVEHVHAPNVVFRPGYS
jgi:FkbM family methyltransferase